MTQSSHSNISVNVNPGSPRKAAGNTDSPLFSIITITFNAADVLPPTMASVAEQSCLDYEHIVIDGASSDSTLSIARSMGGKSLRLLSEPDRGIYDAMNKGLKMAKGKFVIFLNAGDAFHTNHTLAQYAKAALTDKYDIIYGDTVIVDADRKVIGPRHHSAPEILTAESFSHGMLICHQAFAMRRSLAPTYDLRYRFSADYDWTIRCILRTHPRKCHNLHAVTIDYLTAGTTDKNHHRSLAERFDIMKEHYGLSKTILRHTLFIPRAIIRKFKG